MSSITIQQKILQDYFRVNCKPKPKFSGKDWFNKTFYFSEESSHSAGKATLYHWQEEIFNKMTDEVTKEVSLKKSARVGATKMFNAAVGFSIDQDPCSMIVVQPTEGDAKLYAETEIETMVRDNQHIKSSIAQSKITNRSKKEKIQTKFYKGGVLYILGSETPRNFRMKTVRKVFVDEWDACPNELKPDGATSEIIKKRQDDFYNGKVCWVSTPLIKGASKIDTNFQNGSQAQRHLECPHCKELFVLEFEQFSWKLDDDGDLIDESVVTVCPHCSQEIDESYKQEMDKNGVWIHKYPQRERLHSSYHIWAGYSYHYSWAKIVRSYLKAEKDRSLMQGFYNLVLGEVYSEDFDEVKPDFLMEKKETYEYEVPEDVVVLTMAVDTQFNRFEWLVKGWSKKKENWDIAKGVIDGDPALEATRQKLFETTQRYYESPRGKMKPYYVFIDKGGNRTEYIDEFCKGKDVFGIYPIIGANQNNAPILEYKQPKKDDKYNTPYYRLGVNSIKDIVYYHGINTIQGEAYTHYPHYDEWDENYFRGFLSEEKNDKGIWVKKKGVKRNEPFDLAVYNYGAYRKIMSEINLDILYNKGKFLNGNRKVVVSKAKKARVIGKKDIYS